MLEWTHKGATISTCWGQDEMDAPFADDIFKCIFLPENVCVLIWIALKFVPKGPIGNMPVWCHSDKRQAITWANLEQDFWYLVASLDYKAFKNIQQFEQIFHWHIDIEFDTKKVWKFHICDWINLPQGSES